RYYERNLRMQQCETEEHRPFATLDRIAKAGSEPINRRGAAPRGERPPAARTTVAIRAATAAGHVRGPPAPTGAPCPRRPPAAPPRLGRRDEGQAPEESRPRENDDACPGYDDDIVGWAKGRLGAVAT